MMLKSSAKNLVLFAGVIVLPLAIAGCQGSSTYGTGKTSGEHLLGGIGGIAGGSNKKQRIDYAPRPGLVAPQKGSVLPEPLEQGGSSNNSNLPESPEQRRARLQSEAPKAHERSGAIPVEFMNQKRDPSSAKAPIPKYTRDGTIEDYNPQYDRERFLKQKAELAGVNGASQRKYLTEPPRKYRTPHDTAVIGEIGEDEDVKAKRYKTKKGFDWSSLNPFS
jgi:hypothetical protein